MGLSFLNKMADLGDKTGNQELPEFNPDLSPTNSVNVEAAEAHNLKYDPSKGVYVDDDGYLIRDKFGQPF